MAHALVDEFDFTPYRHLLDIRGAWGTVPITVLSRYPSLRATIFELKPVDPAAREYLPKWAWRNVSMSLRVVCSRIRYRRALI